MVELQNTSGYAEFSKFSYKKEAEDYAERTTRNTNATYHIWSRKDIRPVQEALQITKACLDDAIAAIEDKYGQSEVHIFLSGKKNFRDSLAVTKPYKGNRSDTPKPVHYEAIGDYLRAVRGAVETSGHEADDEIGIRAVEAKERQQEYIVVSNDKDLDQIAGKHYDWIKKEFYTVSPKEAKTQFYLQVLQGDSTDNIPGLPGIGPSKAAAALEGLKSPAEMMEKCIELYMYRHSPKEPSFPASYLEEQANLVYILKKPGETWSKTKEGVEFCTKYSLPSAQA
jgi:hypothetical protein